MLNSISKLFQSPLVQLARNASKIHNENFQSDEIQASALLSIKTGGCPENCSYCPQSAHHKTGISKTKLLEKHDVIACALKAKQQGAIRFCMGAAWREVRDGAEFDHVLELVSSVSALGLEVCCTLGMLTDDQALKLKKAGLHFYNHNIDTSPEFYDKIIQTRNFQERLDTLRCVREADLSVCTGGILGLGETDEDRISFIHQLVSMQPKPESITINTLVPIEGTPLAKESPVDPLDIVRVISVIRIIAPKTMIRLSAARTNLSDETQFLCFMVGANSIFLGDKLLTSPNPDISTDFALLERSGLKLQKLNKQKQNERD